MKKSKLISLVLLVFFCIMSFISTATANTVTASSPATDTYEINLVKQGNNYVGTVEIPLKDDSKNSSEDAKSTDSTDSTMSPNAAAATLTVQLYQMPGQNTYEYYYTVNCVGDYVKGVYGRFKLVDTSILDPKPPYSDVQLEDNFAAIKRRVGLISNCYISPDVVSVRAEISGVNVLTVYNGVIPLSQIGGKFVWQIPIL